MKQRARAITFDPGFNLGWAAWRGELCRPEDLFDFGIFNADWPSADQSMWAVAREADRLIRRLGPRWVFIERPFKKGGADVVASSGALVKLALTAGHIGCAALLSGADVRYVEVRDWKGQVGDEIVENRVRAILPALPEGLQPHTIDAIGIGLHVGGHFGRRVNYEEPRR